MQFRFNEHQRALHARFADLGRSVSASAGRHDAEHRFDHESWRRISEAGLWRIPVPSEWGGLGGSWCDCVAAIEGIATTAGDLGFMIAILGHIGALRVLCEQGSADQRARWLERLMGGAMGVTAMTEATGGSDLARMRLAASPAGDGWRLTGRKVHITNAPVAALGMVAGRIPSLGPKRDITLFFLDLDAAGVSLGADEDNLGMRTSPTADIDFDQVRLDPINIVGQPGDGLRLLYRIISFERALYGIIASGLIEGMLHRAMDHVEGRKAFGRPLAENQYIQGRISDMKISSTICRMMTYVGLDAIEADEPDASISCSISKFLAGESLLASAEHLVQLHGHQGFMNNDLSRQLRNAVGMRIAGGTSDIQRVNIFTNLRSLHRKAKSFAPTLAAAE